MNDSKLIFIFQILFHVLIKQKGYQIFRLITKMIIWYSHQYVIDSFNYNVLLLWNSVCQQVQGRADFLWRKRATTTPPAT